METFDEYSDEAAEIMEEIEEALGNMEYYLLVSFKESHHDIARRFLNEVVGFNPSKEG